jgi:hypothetical protein
VRQSIGRQSEGNIALASSHQAFMVIDSRSQHYRRPLGERNLFLCIYVVTRKEKAGYLEQRERKTASFVSTLCLERMSCRLVVPLKTLEGGPLEPRIAVPNSWE